MEPVQNKKVIFHDLGLIDYEKGLDTQKSFFQKSVDLKLFNRKNETTEPTENHPVTYYGDVSDGLFHEILMKYMKDHGSMDFYSKPNNAATGMKKAMPDMHKGHHEEVNE